MANSNMSSVGAGRRRGAVKMAVLGSVTWSPTNPAIGDSVKVDVLNPQGAAYNNNDPTLISVNGVPGSTQYLQFANSGAHPLLVTAVGPAGPEQLTATIQVSAPAAAPVIADPVAGHPHRRPPRPTSSRRRGEASRLTRSSCRPLRPALSCHLCRTSRRRPPRRRDSRRSSPTTRYQPSPFPRRRRPQ